MKVSSREPFGFSFPFRIVLYCNGVQVGILEVRVDNLHIPLFLIRFFFFVCLGIRHRISDPPRIRRPVEERNARFPLRELLCLSPAHRHPPDLILAVGSA